MREVTTRSMTAFWRAAPQEGDIVASRPTARADRFAISVVPEGTHAVDAWYTCNHTQFLRVAHHRSREAS